MHILLIGCGRTGRAIAENLVELKETKELLFYSRTSKSAKGLAADLDSAKVRVLENLSALQKVDYIILSLSGISDSARTESMISRSSTYEVRQDELKFNLGAVADLLRYLKKISSKTRIIVVTNPVDEITNYLRLKLNRNDILGFGMELDAKRYEKVLGKKVFCIGTHGKAIPIINSTNEKKYDELAHKTDFELLAFIRAHGIPHKAAGLAFRDFFERLTNAKEQTVQVSGHLYKPFLGVKDLTISLPFIAKKGKLLRIAHFSPNTIEQKRFVASAKELQHSVNHILDTHQKLLSYK
ncbi:MAG: NAD(P)-binding domain-containing protein [Candidatus Diapherotrites archaeon]|nr:NAD(P)-binding domain-containing protein [Candidatus Diapherotrites archaeon]